MDILSQSTARKYKRDLSNVVSASRNMANKIGSWYLSARDRRERRKTARRIRPKIASLSSLMQEKTRKGKEFEEGGNSITRCHYGKLKSYIPDTVLKTIAPQTEVSNGAAAYTTSIGLQDAVEFDWAPPQTLLGYMTPTINSKMILHSIKGELEMVNASSTNSSLVIYDLIARRDASLAGVSSALNCWKNGVDNAGGSATDYKIVGSVPTEVILFNTFWKVKQRTRVTLGPGQMHRHEFTYNPNKVISGELLNATQYALAGITLATFIVHHGMPAHDSTTTTNVTIDVSSLDVVGKVSIDFRQLADNTQSWNKTNNLATTFAVGEQFVNEAVGQVQDSGGLHPGTLHS